MMLLKIRRGATGLALRIPVIDPFIQNCICNLSHTWCKAIHTHKYVQFFGRQTVTPIRFQTVHQTEHALAVGTADREQAHDQQQHPQPWVPPSVMAAHKTPELRERIALNLLDTNVAPDHINLKMLPLLKHLNFEIRV
jgi:hypothetical protein